MENQLRLLLWGTAERQVSGNRKTAAVFLEEPSSALTFMYSMWKICFMSAIFACKLFRMCWNLICQWKESNCITTRVTNGTRHAGSQLPLGLAQPIDLSWGVWQLRWGFFGRETNFSCWYQHPSTPINCQLYFVRKQNQMWGENGKEAWNPVAQTQQMERMVHIHS